MPTTTTKKKPFKQFYCEDREIFHLPGTALKIWLYHYTREGKDNRKSWPTAETICADLDINQETLFRWRKYLVKNGWLEKVGDHRRLDGEWSVPEYRVHKGTAHGKIVDGHPDKRRGNRTDKALAARKNRVPTHTEESSATHTEESWPTHTKRSRTDAHGKIVDEVDSVFEVDSEEVESGEVDCTPKAKAESNASPFFRGEGPKQTPTPRRSLTDEQLQYQKLKDSLTEPGRLLLKEMGLPAVDERLGAEVIANVILRNGGVSAPRAVSAILSKAVADKADGVAIDPTYLLLRAVKVSIPTESQL
jgi:hypothetical protein